MNGWCRTFTNTHHTSSNTYHLPVVHMLHTPPSQEWWSVNLLPPLSFSSQKPVDIDAHNHNPDSELRQVSRLPYGFHMHQSYISWMHHCVLLTSSHHMGRGVKMLFDIIPIVGGLGMIWVARDGGTNKKYVSPVRHTWPYWSASLLLRNHRAHSAIVR